MDDISNIHVVAIASFGIACVFGALANKTRFCAMGAISDVLVMGSKGRLGAWLGAAGIAVLGSQTLHLTGVIDLGQSRYVGTDFGLLGYLLGGTMFGIGMTLASGCGQRNLVLLGGGNLKAFIVLLVMGITGYMTLRGLLAVPRLWLVDSVSLDFSQFGLTSQSLPSVAAQLGGHATDELARIVLTSVFGLALIGYSLLQPEVRRSGQNLLAALTVGLAVVAGWWVTGHLGADDFEPIALESLSLVAPTGNTISYLMTFTGATIDYGIAAVLGMVSGSLLYALASRRFRIETFNDRADMLRHLAGGALMGVGGVLALGCTIGQGVTGVSTLALGSLIATGAIVFGCVVTLRVSYALMRT